MSTTRSGVYRADVSISPLDYVSNTCSIDDPINQCHSSLEYANYLKYNTFTNHDTGEIKQTTRSNKFIQEVDGGEPIRDRRRINRGTE